MPKQRVACLGLALVLASAGSAGATGNFLCEADDQSLKLSAEASFSHGLGEQFSGFKAALEVLLQGAPKDFARLNLNGADLAHHWFNGPDLKLHIYRESEPSAAGQGYVELIIDTRQEAGDETAFNGTYKLTVYHLASPSDAEGKTLSATGTVSCSVG